MLTLAQGEWIAGAGIKHNARTLCAVAPPVAPIIGLKHELPRRCDCPPLTRPHNGRYVQCPPHGARAPRGGRLRGFFDRVASAVGLSCGTAAPSLELQPIDCSTSAR